MITWNDIIGIIKDTYECTQADIAAQLEVSPSLLSKVKKNERNLPNELDDEYIYQHIFDPTNPRSLSKNKTPEGMLSTVKHIIEMNHHELKEDLEECWNTCDFKQFIMCLLEKAHTLHLPKKESALRHILPEKPVLFGRNLELNRVREIFQNYNYAILHGDLEGIGTSQIALAYAHDLCKSGDWTIQHILCDRADSLQDALPKIQFVNESIHPSDWDVDRIATMLKHIKNKTLIIIDNLNNPISPMERAFFSKLVRSNGQLHFLITSYYDLQYEKPHQLSISTLDDSALLELYEYYRFENSSGHRQFFAEKKEILEKLFNYVGKHTLTVKLIAILARDYLLTEDEIYEAFTHDFLFPEMYIEKDGVQNNCTPQELIKTHYDIRSLSETEKNIMSYMAVVPKPGISIDLFLDLTNCSRRGITALKRKGWILSDTETNKIWVHPMVLMAISDADEVKLFWKQCEEHKIPLPQPSIDDLDIISPNDDVSYDDSDKDEDERENENENDIGGNRTNLDDPEVVAAKFVNPLAAKFVKKVLEHLPVRSHEYILMNQIVFKALCTSYLRTFITRFSSYPALEKKYRKALNTLFTDGQEFLDTNFSQVDISKLTFRYDQSKHSNDTDE